jgi:hypothetical protein
MGRWEAEKISEGGRVRKQDHLKMGGWESKKNYGWESRKAKEI